MLKSGKVSIWVGNFETEDRMLSYVDDGEFGRDFDFKIEPEFGRELKVMPSQVKISQLVTGFSSWKSFADDCAKICEKLGFNQASSMLILYAFEYHPATNVNANARLSFVGVLDF